VNLFQDTKPNFDILVTTLGYAVSSWQRHRATTGRIAGSIPDGVNGFFCWHNLSVRTMALGSIQPLTEISTRGIYWAVQAVGLTILAHSSADCFEIWMSLPSETLRACPSIAVPLVATLIIIIIIFIYCKWVVTRWKCIYSLWELAIPFYSGWRNQFKNKYGRP
jgi:hypothetical protein